jgi:hypothetical protein
MSDTFDINSLTPEELQVLVEVLQGQQAPGAFGGGDYGVSMDPSGMDLAGYNRVDIPQLTTKGKVDPFDLSQQQQRFNLFQDQTSYLDSPMLGALGGAGAFGPDAFQPTYDYGAPLNLVGRKKAQQYMDVGGYQGYIAHLIKDKGMGPDEAAQNAIDLAMNTDASKVTDPTQKALVESLQKSLPAATQSGNQLGIPSGGDTKDLPGGRKRTGDIYDQGRVLKFATDIFEGIASDPTFAYQDPASGNYYAKTPEQAMIKSEAMKAFDKAGLPYMTDKYTDTSYIDKANAAATGRSAEQQAAADTSYQDQLAQMMKDQQDIFAQTKAASSGLDQLRQMQQHMLAQNNTPQGVADLYRTPPQGPPQMQPTVQVPPVAYAQGLSDANYQQQQAAQPTPSPTYDPTQAAVDRVLNQSGTKSLSDLWNYLGPNAKEATAAAPPSPSSTVLRQPPRPAQIPQPAPMFYVDKDGNIVAPPNPAAGWLQGMRDPANIPKQRPASQADMGQLQSQLDRAKQANDDWYQRRSNLLKNDPSLDRFAAFVRANELQKAGRTPTRDALMQRILAQRVSGY